ncbi:PREDICTED: probable uridine nucleosidase 2 isoform X2 [Papilio polytes]|uniref:probable uridine nucleosidase 2 isoform X2 n=1 Tax=Papilio polytes TaxID=76194 RepID=UPI000675F3BD|nr:PREDICTED: probable uridine nucleosidase 2 isoform X2 [Papilio polytes]
MSSIKGRSRPQIIIDNDAGGDDAMAIFLALLYEKHFEGPKLIGLTTGNGNTNLENVCRNNQRILKVAKRQDVPIYRGSEASLVVTPPIADYYGKDGLGDCGLYTTGLAPLKEQSAVTALIELSKIHEGNLIVITLGTLTNVALAIKLDPDFLGRLKQLYVAAGHIQDEENPEPEFNASMDIEAYHIVTQYATPDKVTVFPFSQVKTYLNLTRDWRLESLGKIDTDIMRAQNQFEKIAIDKNEEWQALDPAAVAVAINEDLVEEYKYSKNGIITCGKERGINTNHFVEKEDANVKVVYSVKEEEYKEFLLNVLSKEA